LLDGHWIQTASINTFDEHTRGFQDRLLIFGADGNRTTLDYKSTLLFDTAILGGEHHSITGLVENRREDYRQMLTASEFFKNRTSVAGEYALGPPTSTATSVAGQEEFHSGFQGRGTCRGLLR